jgi:hypothetical protein
MDKLIEIYINRIKSLKELKDNMLEEILKDFIEEKDSE